MMPPRFTVSLEESLLLAKVAGGAIAFGLWRRAERARPLARERRAHAAHTRLNLGMLAVNAMTAGLLTAAPLVLAANWSARHDFGLLHGFDPPPFFQLAIAITLLDLWAYLWHVANHALPGLWRFHRVHHDDPRVDATTAFRVHPGEVILSGWARIPVMLALGLDLWHVLAYEVVVLQLSLLHHANLRLPPVVESLASWLVVTPGLHTVHHSRRRAEQSTNLGAVLSIWDTLFGTRRFRRSAARVRVGLAHPAPSRETDTLGRLLRMPFGRLAEPPESKD